VESKLSLLKGTLIYTEIKKAVEKILDSLYTFREWEKDINLKDTPERVAKMYIELCSGLFEDREERLKEIFSAIYPSELDELVIAKDIEAISICPHHLLPIVYKVHIGYLPNGYVLGLSKLPRLVKFLASKPLLQENLTCEIADNLMKYLKPKGCMVIMNGIHSCVMCRGVRDKSTFITSVVRGEFLDPSLKEEFLRLIKI